MSKYSPQRPQMFHQHSLSSTEQLAPVSSHVAPSRSVPFLLSSHLTSSPSDDTECTRVGDKTASMGRFRAARLSIMASISGRRLLPLASNKGHSDHENANGVPKPENQTKHENSTQRNQCSRGASSDSSSAQYAHRRPVSHLGNLSKVMTTIDENDKDDEQSQWRHSLGPWVLISSPSSDGGDSLYSNGTQSTCCSSTSSVVAQQQLVDIPELGNNEVANTPVSAAACSSICPTLETRIRNMVSRKKATRRAMTFSGTTTLTPTNVLLTSLQNLPSTQSVTTQVPTLAPVRARTMFASNQRRKEMKAITHWRHTVSQMLLEDAEGSVSPPSPLSPDSATATLSTKGSALCKFIINELYTTEVSYCKLLTLIKNCYMDPMVAATLSKSPWVKANDVQTLFRHLPDLVNLSNKLIASLEPYAASMWRNIDPIQLGRIFQTLEEDMVVFLKYAVHYQANTKAIRRACNSVLFLKIEQECTTSRDTNRMGIADYLIAPFQRVPRYCLLVKDLLKHTHHVDNQPNDLDLSLKMLTGLVVAMDRVQRLPSRQKSQ